MAKEEQEQAEAGVEDGGGIHKNKLRQAETYTPEAG